MNAPKQSSKLLVKNLFTKHLFAKFYIGYLIIFLTSCLSSLTLSGVLGDRAIAQGLDELEQRVEDFGKPPEAPLPEETYTPPEEPYVPPEEPYTPPEEPYVPPEQPVTPAAPPAPRERIAPRAIIPPDQPTLTPVQFGFPQPGVLGQADYLTEDGRRIEFFQFEGVRGQPIVLTVSGSRESTSNPNFSPNVYMALIAPDGETIIDRNDIAGGERTTDDERLWIKLPEAGNYLIAVFTDPGKEARFSLALQRDTTRYRLDDSNALTDDNPRLDDESPFYAYPFTTNYDGQFVNIVATSPDFDPYLILLDSDFNVVAADNDSGGNFNSLLRGQLPQGNYYIVVNSLRPEGRGRYRVLLY